MSQLQDETFPPTDVTVEQAWEAYLALPKDDRTARALSRALCAQDLKVSHVTTSKWIKQYGFHERMVINDSLDNRLNEELLQMLGKTGKLLTPQAIMGAAARILQKVHLCIDKWELKTQEDVETSIRLMSSLKDFANKLDIARQQTGQVGGEARVLSIARAEAPKTG